MNQELNDIFVDVNTETPIDNSADVPTDDGIKIEIVNSANNARNSYIVYPENTLAEVIAATYAKDDDLGLRSSGEQLIFEYEGQTYSDTNLTVKKLGFVNGSKLLVHPSGTVAAM